MRLVAVLASAGAAAVMLTAAATVDLVMDPVVRGCAAALEAVDAANAAHQEALAALDSRARRDGERAASVAELRLHVELAKAELDAARTDVQQLCHFRPTYAPGVRY